MTDAKWDFDPEKKRIRHYGLTEEDLLKILDGEEIFFYNGREIDIHLKCDKLILDKVKEKLKNGS